MKLITAIVRPEKLDEIVDAVIGNNGRGLTVSTVRGFGRQFGKLAGRAASTDAALDGLPVHVRPVLLSKVRLDIVVADQDVRAMVDARRQARPHRHNRRRQDLGVRCGQRAARPDGRARSRRGLTHAVTAAGRAHATAAAAQSPPTPIQELTSAGVPGSSRTTAPAADRAFLETR